MVKFNQTHMTKLENLYKLTPAQRQGLDTLPSDFADILSTFNWAMFEGSAALIHYNADPIEKEETINFVGQFCYENKIDYDILINEEDNCYHLFLY